MIRYSTIVYCWLLFWLCCFQGHTEEAKTGKASEPAEAQSMIDTLENTEAREHLISQLKLLVKTQKEMAHPRETPTLGSTTIDLLESLSNSITRFVDTTVEAATMFHQIPKVGDWLTRQLMNLDQRHLWLSIIENLTVIIGSGYITFFIVRWLLKHLREALEHATPQGFTMRMSCLFLSLLLDLLPIITFTLFAYLMMGLIQPTKNIRLVVIAWINAAIIVHMVTAFIHFFFVPQFPSFRKMPVSRETVRYAVNWGRSLSVTGGYGYFALQVAFLLGLPLPLYETLLRFLGLLVSVLLIVLILQIRQGVARYIGGGMALETRMFHPRHLLQRLAPFWHIPAISYVLMLYGIWALALSDGFLFILEGTLLTALILIAGNALVWFIEQPSQHGFWINEASRQRFPGLESRCQRYLPTMLIAVKWLIYMLILLAVLQAWGVPSFGWMTTGVGRMFGVKITRIVGTVLITLLIWEIVTLLLESYTDASTEKAERRKLSARMRTLLSVAHNALLIILTVMATLIVLSDLGINIAPLLTGVGVAGLAVGFGAQKLVQDIITGIFILFEDLIEVGDVVSVGNKDGQVEAITIRTIRLRDGAGSVHTIPFSSIGPITNMTREFAYYVFDVSIAYREDIDAVMAELAAIGQEMMQEPKYASLILAPLEILGLDSFQSDSIKIKTRIKTLPSKQWEVGREFNLRMKKRFDQLSIEMSSSKLTVCIEREPQQPPDPDSSKITGNTMNTDPKNLSQI